MTNPGESIPPAIRRGTILATPAMTLKLDDIPVISRTSDQQSFTYVTGQKAGQEVGDVEDKAFLVISENETPAQKILERAVGYYKLGKRLFFFKKKE